MSIAGLLCCSENVLLSSPTIKEKKKKVGWRKEIKIHGESQPLTVIALGTEAVRTSFPLLCLLKLCVCHCRWLQSCMSEPLKLYCSLTWSLYLPVLQPLCPLLPHVLQPELALN